LPKIKEQLRFETKSHIEKCMFYFLIYALLVASQIEACTDFLLRADDQNIVVGRSMEFGTPLDSEIILNPRGREFETKLDKGQPGLKWTSKYNYAGFTYFGTDDVVDGVNEKGLSLGALWFPTANYPKVDFSKPETVVPISLFADWILGSFASLSEVEKAMESIQIWPSPVPKIERVPPLHFSIHDRFGKSLVIEFLNGKVVMSENPVSVLTNAPHFEWHLINLKNYINLSASNVGPISFHGTVLDPTGQGTGMLGLPGDWTPPSRFVRIALMKQFVATAKNSKENTNLAYHLLNTVDIPYGTIRANNEKDYDFTQWITVKDLSNFSLSYRTYGDLCPTLIDLKAEFSGLKEPKKLSLNGQM
jgi:choloylglycine hydrolase